MKVEVLKHPNGLVPAPSLFRARELSTFAALSTERRARAYHLFIFVPFYLVTPVERVDVLLSVANVPEPVDVRYEGQPGRHLLR